MSACSSTNGLSEVDSGSTTHLVEITQFQFRPSTLVIHPGDTVRWLNRDLVPHHLEEEFRKKWSSHDIKPDDSYSNTIFESASYVCTLHPGMQAKIKIEESQH